jgi:hypothetical protein
MTSNRTHEGYEHELWDELLDSIFEGLDAPQEGGENLQEVFRAIIAGGIEAAHLVYDAYASSLAIFGVLDPDRAAGFAEVFCSAMASRFLDAGAFAGRRERAHDSLAYLVRQVFGVDSARREEEARLCELQYVKDRGSPGAEERTTASAEELLLVSIAARTLGATFGWKLASPPLPVDSPQALRMAGWRPPLGLSLDESGEEVAGALLAGQIEMLEWLDEAGLVAPLPPPTKGRAR